MHLPDICSELQETPNTASDKHKHLARWQDIQQTSEADLGQSNVNIEALYVTEVDVEACSETGSE